MPFTDSGSRGTAIWAATASAGTVVPERYPADDVPSGSVSPGDSVAGTAGDAVPPAGGTVPTSVPTVAAVAGWSSPLLRLSRNAVGAAITVIANATATRRRCAKS